MKSDHLYTSKLWLDEHYFKKCPWHVCSLLEVSVIGHAFPTLVIRQGEGGEGSAPRQ